MGSKWHKTKFSSFISYEFMLTVVKNHEEYIQFINTRIKGNEIVIQKLCFCLKLFAHIKFNYFVQYFLLSLLKKIKEPV